jgi:hypothetical protein
MRFARAALAATVLAAGLSTFAGTAHATDACNDGGSGTLDGDVIYITNLVRVATDDPTTGFPGVVVVCVGIFEEETTQVGGGITPFPPNGTTYTLILCLPVCHEFPPRP